MASCTIAHQIRFWSKPCSGRLARPVSLAARMRSSHRARRRWRSSRSGSWPRAVLVTNAVKRSPSRSVNRSCAPGCGRSFFTHDHPHPGRPAGQVQHAGGLSHPRAVTDPVVGVISRGHADVGTASIAAAIASVSVNPIDYDSRRPVRWCRNSWVPPAALVRIIVTVLALHTQGGNGGARRGSRTTQRPQVRMLSPLPVSPPPLSPPPAEMPFVNGLVNPSAARRVQRSAQLWRSSMSK